MILSLTSISREITTPRLHVWGIDGRLVDSVPGRATCKITATTSDFQSLQSMASIRQLVTLVKQGNDFAISDDPNDDGPKGCIVEYNLHVPMIDPITGLLSPVSSRFSAEFEVLNEDLEAVNSIDFESIRIENKSW